MREILKLKQKRKISLHMKSKIKCIFFRWILHETEEHLEDNSFYLLKVVEEK